MRSILPYFEVAAILLSPYVLSSHPSWPSSRVTQGGPPRLRFVLYSGMWAVFLRGARLRGETLALSAQVLGLLMAVGIVVASACASLAARIGSW